MLPAASASVGGTGGAWRFGLLFLTLINLAVFLSYQECAVERFSRRDEKQKDLFLKASAELKRSSPSAVEPPTTDEERAQALEQNATQEVAQRPLARQEPSSGGEQEAAGREGAPVAKTTPSAKGAARGLGKPSAQHAVQKSAQASGDLASLPAGAPVAKTTPSAEGAERGLGKPSAQHQKSAQASGDLASLPAGLEGKPSALCRAIWKEAILREEQSPHYAEFNHELTSLPSEHPNIVLHVGKAAGASMHNAFETRGLMKVFDWLHVHPASPEHLRNKQVIVVPLRDPIDRTISAFRFLKTEVKKEKNKARLTGDNGTQRGFFNCFPSVDAFAVSLDKNTLCGQRARYALTDPEVFRGHLNKGICFYVGGLLEDFRRNQVRAIRSSHFTDDINRLMKQFHKEPFRDDQLQVFHNNSKASISASLSPEGRRKLEHFLRHEYYAFHELLSMDPTIKVA